VYQRLWRLFRKYLKDDPVAHDRQLVSPRGGMQHLAGQDSRHLPGLRLHPVLALMLGDHSSGHMILARLRREMPGVEPAPS